MQDADEQIHELELSMEQAKDVISDMEALIRLSNDSDFKKVIDRGYFVNEASRLVLSKALPSMSTDSMQKEIDNAILAISYLRKHFTGIMSMGRMAEKSLQDAEMTRDEILQEVSA